MPLLSCWNNFIKLLNKFVINTIMNVHCSLFIVGSRFAVSLSEWLTVRLGLSTQLVQLQFDVAHWLLPIYVASMFSALTNSFPIGCISCSSCICTSFNTHWCITWCNYILRHLVTNFDKSWNQQVLENQLHYFLTWNQIDSSQHSKNL